MARHEQDREDLLRQATALIERVELEVPGFDDPVVIGFRRDGSASFFFGADPVLQFNSRGQLRRGYWKSQLIKAENGELFAMERIRTEGEVILQSRSLTTIERSEFLQLASQLLEELLAKIRSPQIRIVGQVPAESPVLPRIQNWLETHAGDLTIASRPNAR